LEFNVPFQHKYGYIRDEQYAGNKPLMSRTCAENIILYFIHTLYSFCISDVQHFELTLVSF